MASPQPSAGSQGSQGSPGTLKVCLIDGRLTSGAPRIVWVLLIQDPMDCQLI